MPRKGPKGPKVTKTQRCVQWLLKHPGAKEKDAQRAGWNVNMYYTAKRLIKESRPPSEQPVMAADDVAIRQYDPAMALLEILEKMGVKEAHFKDGILMVGELTWREVRRDGKPE